MFVIHIIMIIISELVLFFSGIIQLFLSRPKGERLNQSRVGVFLSKNKTYNTKALKRYKANFISSGQENIYQWRILSSYLEKKRSLNIGSGMIRSYYAN